MLRRMKKVPLISLFASLLFYGCSTDGALRWFVNSYDNYDEMVEDLAILKENCDDGKNEFCFDFHMDGYTTSYYVGGADYCLYYGYIDNFDEHDPNRCEYLHNREIYYELSKEDAVVTITFGTTPSDDLSSIYWGDVSQSIKENECQSSTYCLFNENKSAILTLKFDTCDTDEETITSFEDSLLQSISEMVSSS